MSQISLLRFLHEDTYDIILFEDKVRFSRCAGDRPFLLVSSLGDLNHSSEDIQWSLN